MSSDYFDSATVNVPAYTTADSSDVNNVSAAVDVGLQKLPAPLATAPTNKGFSEHFNVADVVEEDDCFSLKQQRSFDLNSAADTGSANSYAIALSPAIAWTKVCSGNILTIILIFAFKILIVPKIDIKIIFFNI